MSCEEMNDRLHEYIDGELSQFERAQVETHLRRCPACTEELRLLRQTVALLADLDEVDVPASFRPQLMARIATLPVPAPAPAPAPIPLGAARRARVTPLWQRWGLPSAAVAAVAALVAINIIGPMSERVTPENVDTPMVAAPTQPPPAEVGPVPHLSGTADITEDPGPQPEETPQPVAEDPPPAQPQDNGKPSGKDSSPKPSDQPDNPVADVPVNPVTPGEPQPGEVFQDPGLAGASTLSDLPPTDGPDVRGMGHNTMHVTVRTADVSQAADKVHALANDTDGTLVYEEYLPDGSLRFTFEVPEGSERPLLDGVAALGELMEQRTDWRPLQSEYDSLLARQKINQDTLIQSQADAEDPTQPAHIRQAARDDIAARMRLLAGIRQKLSELESEDRYTTFHLTLEAQR